MFKFIAVQRGAQYKDLKALIFALEFVMLISLSNFRIRSFKYVSKVLGNSQADHNAAANSSPPFLMIFL